MSGSELESRLIVAAPEQRDNLFSLTGIQQAYCVSRREDIELGGVTTQMYYQSDCTALSLGRLGTRKEELICTPDYTAR